MRRLILPMASLLAEACEPFASLAFFCEKSMRWLTPKGPHMVKKSLNLFDFLSRRRLAVFGSMT